MTKRETEEEEPEEDVELYVEDEEEEEPQGSSGKGSKRVADLDADDTMKRVQVMIPHKRYKWLRERATEKECSGGAIMQEALRDYQKKVAVEPSSMDESDEKLMDILDGCSTFYGGFEIEEEEGFIETMVENKFKLKDLTSEQWEKVQEKLLIGYKGYLSAPKGEEFVEKFDVLEPTEEQRQWLLDISEDTETEEDEY